MSEYRDLKTGTIVTVSGEKFAFPTSGARILLKLTPPVAREVKSD